MSNKTGKQDPLRTVAGAQFAHSLKLEPHSANELQNELEVHQIELKMQNEQLRQTQVALEESRDRYVDLYEFAPVGYLTLNHEGMIDEINLTGATLLGVERSKLLHRRFAHFVAPENLDCWHRHFLNVLTRDDTVTCEVALQPSMHGNRSRFYARLDCLRVSKAGKIPVVRVALADITERKQAESMLRASEEKFRALFENTLDGVLLADAESRRFATGNPAICRMLGYSHEELTRLSVSDIHPPQDLQHAIEQFEGQLRGEIQLSADLPVKRRDGSVFYADINSSAVNFGDKTYLLGVFRDSTERKLAEETLHKAYDKLCLFRTLLDKSSDAIEVIDPITLRFLDVNKTACRDIGYSREELLSMSLYDVDPSISQATKTMLGEQIQKSGTARLESIHRRKDGSTFPVEVSIVTVNLDRPYGLSIARDITERKKLELDKEQYLKFFMLSINPMCIADPHGCFKQVNPAFVQLTGYSESELIAKPFLEFVLPEDRQRTDDEMKLQVANRPTLQFDNRYLCKNGTVINLSWTAYYDKHDGASYATAIDITAQRQAMADLAESENRFRLIAETIAEVFWMGDVAVSKMFYISPAYEHIWGRSTQSLYENPGSFIEAIHPDDVTRVLADLELKKTGQPFDHEYRIHRPDGTLRWIWDRGFPIHEPTGEVLRYVGIARDISVRKRAEEALKKSEARHRSFIEVTGQLAWVTGADGSVVEDIPTWRAFAGMSAEQAKGWGWIEALHPDDRERAAQMWRDAVARKGVYELEYRVRRRDGIYRDFFARGVPVLDASGGVREWVGTSIDITELKHAEDALQKSEEQYRRIVETAQEGIWIIDANNKTTFANKRIATLLGYTVEEMLGMSLFDFMDEAGKAIASVNVERRRQGIIEQHDFKFQRKDGTELQVIIETSPMVNEGGEYVGALAMITDITARIRSQSQLIEQLDELRRWHEVTSGREARVLELKHEVNELLASSGQPPRYPSAESQDLKEE